ncbi:MAG: DUF58 domain-containing protein, partial [Rhodoferax sp.]|nr:DUF58 domain-containing protein [Rhodoferax sp.]
RAGLLLAATLLVLLVASINYQLNLGYLLTFLLAGCALVAIHVAHGTLRGLTMNVIAPDAVFAGTNATFDVQLVNQRRRPRWAISVAVAGSDQWVCSDVAGQASASVQLRWRPARRGLHRLPTLSARTLFPLGTFRVWTVWRPAAQVLVYPHAEDGAPPLPLGAADAQAGPAHASQHSGEPDGVRPYRRGDALKNIVWKKAAKTGELVSRDSAAQYHHTLWLERPATALSDPEAQLARLCAWVLQAHALGLHYGLRVGNTEIAPDHGPAQLERCLRALALA